ncbi:metalloregulator ArsR/SmtB family transcription factor [Paenibacillus tarimensis]
MMTAAEENLLLINEPGHVVTGVSLREKVQLVISPFHEMLCSLHVLYRPEHHTARRVWAERLKQEAPLLWQRARDIGAVTEEWIGIVNLPVRCCEPMSVQEGLRRLELLPDAELLEMTFNYRYPLEQVLRWMSGEDRELAESGLGERQRVLLTSPSCYRKELLAVLKEYADYFKQEWRLVLPLIQAEAERFQAACERNVIKALNSLHPRLAVTGGEIVAYKTQTYRYAAGALGKVLIIPSSFIAPHLLIGCGKDVVSLPLAVDSDPTAGSLTDEWSPPVDLLGVLKGLADGTRLRLVKLIWRGPQCTRQLAQLLRISEAAVSKHLKILQQAGLVYSERKGNYQYYSLQRSEIDRLSLDMLQFLEQPAVPEK